MNPAQQLIADLQAMNARLEVKRGKIALDAPTGIVTPVILRRLKKLKREIIVELQQPAPVCDSAPCPVDFAERAALIADGCGISQQEADQRTAQEYGQPDFDSLCSETVTGWKNRLAACDPYVIDWRHAAMLAALIAFCYEWGLLASQMEWDATALFGIDPNAPYPDRQRHDRHGIAVQLAVSKLPGIRLVELTREQAVFQTATGAIQRASRFHPARDNAAPVWEAVDLQ